MSADDDKRPIVFLDVDGVINCFGLQAEIDGCRRLEVPLEPPSAMSSEAAARIQFLDEQGQLVEQAPVREAISMPIFVRPEIAEHLRRLDEHCQVVWCTAWFANANRILEALDVGIGPFEVLHWDDLKLEAILAHRADDPDRRWVFVDDDVSMELRQLPDFELPANGLLIETDPQFGLTERHLSEIIGFCRRS